MSKKRTSNQCPPKPCKPCKPKSPSFSECEVIMGGGAGPQGPDGPLGDAGPAMSTPFDPDQSCSYVAGQVIYYKGMLWVANENCPPGTPGAGPGYSVVTNVVDQGVTGPTGPTGIPGDMVVIPYDPDQSGSYKKGQIIYKDGHMYQVMQDDPQGEPGSSSDYQEIPPSIAQGPTGPMGPDDIADATIYDPSQSCGYKQGQLIYYKGNLYVATKDCPDGTPGSSCDYIQVDQAVIIGVTGPTGPTGTRFPTPWDPSDTTSYVPGSIVYYNGNLYEVNTPNPQGIPGESPDYTLIPNNQLDGPTGPGGVTTTEFYDPNGIYKENDLIYYNGNLYVVNKDNPSGTPDSSSDYTLVDNVWSATGPQGTAGPQGPEGVCVCQGLMGQNTANSIAIGNTLSDMENTINNQQDQLDQDNDRLDQDEQNIQDNTDEINDLENESDAMNDDIQSWQNTVSYCGCAGTKDGCQPYMLRSDSNNTQIQQIGTPCVVGTFFGCPIYRQCYYGQADPNALGNISIKLPTSTANPLFMVDSGGTLQYIYADALTVGAVEMVGGGLPALAVAGSFQAPVIYHDYTYGVGVNGQQSGATHNSNSGFQIDPNNGMVFTLLSTPTTGTFRFWMYTDYVASDCTPSPTPTDTSGLCD